MLVTLLCCVMCGCSKPVSQRIEGEWKFDEAESKALWDSRSMSIPARKKITALVDSGTISIDGNKVTLEANDLKTSVRYEILQNDERILVARIESYDGRKRAEIKVEMPNDDMIRISSNHPVSDATAVLSRHSENED